MSDLCNWRKTANGHTGKIHWTFINRHTLKTTMAKHFIWLQRVYFFYFEDSFELFEVSQLLPSGGENLCVPFLFSPEYGNP